MSLFDLRTKYLAESSQLLSTTSPSVAAALTVERFTLEDSLSEPQKRHQEMQCLACGSANISIRTSWPKQNSSHSGRSKPKHPTKSSHQYRKLIRACRTCKRVLHHTFPAPVKPSDTVTTTTTKDHSNRQDTIRSGNIEDTPIKSNNTSSKKRAKARKEGLQALLNKSKQDAKPTHTFTLADFMRPT